MKKTIFPALLFALLPLLPACGGGGASVSVLPDTGGTVNGTGSGTSGSGASGTQVIVALPVDPEDTVLDRLNDRGHASGFRPNGDAIRLPVMVSESNVALASEANFFGGDQADWSLLRTAASNAGGVVAGHGVVGGAAVAWLWDGTPAVRLPAPPGTSISQVVGPSDTGSLAATSFNPDSGEQEVLLWQPNGSRSSIYRVIPVKAGMSLFGMAANGWVGGVERDGILLTPKIYDGFWRPLPIDVIECQCEAVALNVLGQVLMNPRRDLGGDPRGYLVSTSGATLLPRPDPGARYTGLNDLGDVVGNADSGPFVIQDGIVHELNAYIGSAQLGWRLLSAESINNRRQVLGLGEWQGRRRWYRLDLP